MNRYFKTSPGKYPGAGALWALFLLLTVGFALPIQAQFTAQSDTLATMLTAQSCANGAIDPGETVTLAFRIKNTSGAAKANVKATLLQQGNVTFPVTAGQTFPYASGQVTIGAMAIDAIATVSFQFRVEGTCGAFITPAIAMVADSTTAQTITFSSITPSPTVVTSAVNNELGLRVATVRDTATPGAGVLIPAGGAITIQDFGPALTSSTGLGRANNYPSTVSVSGVPHVIASATFPTGERVSKVEVLVNGLTHAFSQDVQLLLVGPQGNTVMLMNDAGAQSGNQALNNVNLVFTQTVLQTGTVASALPQTTPIDPTGVSGTTITARPSNYGPNDTMPSGAPAGPYGTSLDVFGTIDRTLTPPNPNGDWKLYVVDDTAGGAGTITSWSLRITTMKIDCCTTALGGTLPHVSVASVTAINEDSTASNTPQNIATFTVNDLEGGVVTLTRASATTTLVPTANIEIVDATPTITAGTAVTKTVRVTGNGLVANANGTSVITITATDPLLNVITTSFTLTVNSVNDLPTITSIANQSANVGTATGQLNFTVGDVETTDLTTLILVPSSSDQSVVPNGNIFFGGRDDGTPDTRTVQVFPASGTTSGTATITITVRDSNGGETPTSFVVAFNVQPGFPTITPISAQSTDEDPATAKTVTFTVAAGSGSSTAAGALNVTASSSNTGAVASTGISITQPNAGGSASVALTPVANGNGATTITLNVTDGLGTGATTDDRTTTTTFVLTVNSINDAPTITGIVDQVISEDTSTAALAFTIGDVENGTTLTLSASSSDTSIVPSTIVNDVAVPGVTFGGSAASRTVSVKPAANAFGSAAVTVTVTDANGGTATSVFRVTVNAVNDDPIVTQAGISGGTLVNLANNATDEPITVTVNEDTGEFTVALAGVAPGPTNEDLDQDVSFSVTSGDTTKVEVRTVDTGTLAYGSTRTFSNVGSGPTFVLKTKLDATGDAVITLVLTDNLTSPPATPPPAATTTRKFKVRITVVNDAPTIAAIADRPSEQSGAGLSVPISVADTDPSSTLTVTATSSNQAIVKDSNMFAVAGNTQLSILTEAGAGTTTITVTVTDQTGLSASRTFNLTTSNIAPPSVSISPTSATIDEDTITSATITGTGQGTLTFTKNSANTTLVPNDNVIISGSGNTRTLVIVPAADQPPGAPGTTATSAISVTVTDARGASATTTFNLTVRAIPDNPTLTLLGNLASGSVTIVEDAAATNDSTRTSGKFEIKAFDAEDLAGAGLVLNVASSNTALIPNGVTATSGGVGVVLYDVAADGTRKIEIKPVADQFGTAVLTLTASDSSGRVATATINVTVSAKNDAPLLTAVTAANATLTLNEDFGTSTITLGGISAGPSNESGQGLTVSIVSAFNGGTETATDRLSASVTSNVTFASGATTGGTATLTLTSIANKNGDVAIKVRVTDDGGTSNSGVAIAESTFTVTITSVNDQPSLTFANAAVTVIQPGTSAGFTVVPFTVSDVETSAFSLNVTGTSANGAIVVTPSAGDFGGSGTDRSVRISAFNTTITGTVNVTITVDDNSGTANATRAQVLAVTVTIPSVNPSITASPTEIKMAPNTESSIITLTVADFQQAVSQLSVTYTSDNTGVIPSGSQTVSSGQNGATTAVQFQGTGVATRQVIVRPTANQFGVVNLTFTVHDNDTTDHVGTATLRVVVSTNPTATPDTASVNIPQNSGATTTAITVADNETATGFLSLTATSGNTTLIPQANVSVTSGSSSNRRNVTFTPVANSTGASTITLVVTDSDGLTGTNTFVVNVANNAPTITGPSTASIAANGSAILTFTVADTETASGSLGAMNVTAATGSTTLIPVGNVSIAASGATRTVTITPVANQVGSTTVTLTVTDSQGGTGQAAVLVTVTNSNPTFTTVPSAQSIAEGGSTGALTFTVSDAETAVSELVVSASSSNTTLVPSNGISVPLSTAATRNITVTPALGQSGTATITLTVQDSMGGSGTATFVVTVVANNPPTTTGLPSALTVQLNQSATVTFTVNDTETAAASVQTTYTSSNSALVNASTGIQQATATSGSRTIVITPTSGQSGVTTITVTATDGGGKTAQGSFTLTVSSNTAPTITPTTLANQTVNKNTPTSSQSFSINDTETPTSLTLAGSSSNPTLVPTGNIALSGTGNSRTVVVTPANNQVGTATVTITVTDSGGLTASANFTVTVLQTAPVKGDMDGDGKSDILFQDSDGFLAFWLMNGRNLTSASFLLPSNLGDVNYRIAGTGDFNRDGQEDIIFQHSDGTMAVWFMSGTSQASAQLVSPSSPGDGNWKIVAVADMDADQNADLLFQHTDGSLAVWYLNGVTQRSASLLSPGTSGDRNWRVVGVGDFNTDGKQDLAFQHTDGTLAAWYMNGIAQTQPTFLTPVNPGSGWRVVGVADRNGDGKADLLFQHTDYSVAVWYMNGVTQSTAQLLNPSNSGATWRAVSPK